MSLAAFAGAYSPQPGNACTASNDDTLITVRDVSVRATHTRTRSGKQQNTSVS